MSFSHQMTARLPIYHLVFPNRYLLTSTFLRFQEHYESPKFREKIFSLEEFIDWYAKENGKFTYFKDWCGFNLPSCIFAPFHQGDFDPLSNKEKALIQEIKRIKEKKFYLIATIKDEGAVDALHEIMHALFYLFPDYAEEVISEIKKLPKEVRGFERYFRKVGYHQEVWFDEIAAYALVENNKKRKKMRVKKKGFKLVKSRLTKIFKKHFGVSPKSKKLLSRIHSRSYRTAP